MKTLNRNKTGKKYSCAECGCSIEIKIISIESDEHTKVQFCPFCSDYLEDFSADKNSEVPLLKDFDEYDEFDEEKYYNDYEDDLDESEE
jgi:hypothetical protein